MPRQSSWIWFGLGLVHFHSVAAVVADRDCTRIVSGLERLACFDDSAGTPVAVKPLEPLVVEPPQPPVFALVQGNERQRSGDESGFVMSITEEDAHSTQQRVVISAPALGAAEPRPYLTISCQSNISHLQLLLAQPLQRSRVNVQLFVDGRPVAGRRAWQVLEGGRVVDAGRGLPAVDLIRHLGGGQRIRVGSDEERLDGLVFDAAGLAPLITEERKACHW